VSPGRSRDQLGSYKAKRDFTRTPEPVAGEAGHKEKAARFVIQEHSARRLHWDLRLERDGVLASWALPRGLPLEPKQNFIAPHTEDHPLSYLDFHGEIPAGNYGAGTMTIWDRGTYETLKWEPRKVEVDLHGERVRGRYALFAIGKEDPTKDWMIHRMDPASDAGAESMPEHVAPMMARAGSLPREDAGWSYEIKWDGVRAIAYWEPARLRFESRNLLEITARYPELARLGRALGSHRAVLDGEIVSFDEDGRPSFERLAQRIHLTGAAAVKRLAQSAPVTYLIFDLIWLDGHSLIDHPYAQRREALAGLALNDERWLTPEPLRGSGRDVLAASERSGLEGIVAKRLDSRYRPGQRDGSWLKIKNTARQELVIGGFTVGAGRRGGSIGALLVGVPDDGGGLRFAGKVGTGFSDDELDRLAGLLRPLIRDRSPFVAGGPLKLPRGATFVQPRLVAEVEFREWTRDGALRAPSYKGLRDDKEVSEVVRETVAKPAREVKLSNLDKVLYPETGMTKREVIDYYERVAPVLLAHLRDRPLTVKRYPDGVEGKAFFEKRSPRHRPDWVRTFAVRSERQGTIDYTVVDDLETLIWLANLAALELHAPLALAADLDHPTAMVFDLDPGPPAGVAQCARVACLLKGTFDELGLRSYAKTSGSKGLQVYVPLAGASFEDTKRFSEGLAQLFERNQGELVVSKQAKSLRPGKVLIDWSQNDAHKTTICAYSLRARPRPTVSTPVDWDEVKRAMQGKPLSFEAREVLKRVTEHGDLFAPVLGGGQKLPAL
jgi:bifunctional non-homologous end joining protein LigD